MSTLHHDASSSVILQGSYGRPSPLPLFVFWVFATADVHLAFPVDDQLESLKHRKAADRLTIAQPSQNSLIALRTFIPRVCNSMVEEGGCARMAGRKEEARKDIGREVIGVVVEMATWETACRRIREGPTVDVINERNMVSSAFVRGRRLSKRRYINRTATSRQDNQDGKGHVT